VVHQSKPTALLVGALGLAALIITAVINFRFGKSLALDSHDALIQAFSGLVIDAMGAALAVVAVALWRSSQRLAGAITGVVLTGCFVYSTLSVIGFGAQGRVERARVTEMTQAAKAEATEIATRETLKRQQSAMEWLQGTYRTSDRGEKKTLIDAVTTMASRPVEVQVALPTQAMGDAQAEFFADVTGWRVASVQTTILTMLAVLLKVGEVTCFGLSSAMWPRKSNDRHQNAAGITSDRGSFQENQRLIKSDASLLHNGPITSDASTTSVAEAQFALTLPYTETAARRDYEAMKPDVRDGLSHRYLSGRWGVHRLTVAKWRRGWEAERQIGAPAPPPADLRLLNGGRAH